jgi:hypothetical protein
MLLTLFLHMPPQVKNDEYYCHVYVKADLGLAAVVVADQEYPNLAAFSIITKVREKVAPYSVGQLEYLNMKCKASVYRDFKGMRAGVRLGHM